MVFFGRKEKLEDRRLLASMDTMNGSIIHQIDNGKSLSNYRAAHSSIIRNAIPHLIPDETRVMNGSSRM